MTIFTLIRRQILGNRPDQVRDHTEGYYATKALAEDAINRIFGKWAVKHEDFFEDYYTSTVVPNVEYYITEVVVITD